MTTKNNPPNLQQLLLPCKKNCKFDLLTDNPSEPRHYYIYLGIIAVDCIPNDKGHFLYKLMCARLALAGFQLNGLEGTFGYSARTISKWATILNGGDSGEIAVAFGFTYRGKITPEIQSYIKNRYLYFLKIGKSDYRKTILTELKEYFDLTVTGEGIRPYFRQADTEQEGETTEKQVAGNSVKSEIPDDNEVSAGANPDAGNPKYTCAETGFFEVDPRKSCSDPGISGSVLTVGGNQVSLNLKTPPASKEMGVPVSGERPPYIDRFFHHAGLVLLLPYIDKLTAGLGEGTGICRQLLGQFLLGALNLEQGKTVSKEFFQLFFGTGQSYIQGMRDFVYEISSLDFRLKLAGRNGEILKNGLFRQKIFYYDPHTKKYTGSLLILSGWCGSLHETAKILISDYIHSVDGCPCFVEHYDNLYDLRTRFFFTVAIFKRLFPENLRNGLTWIIDRGIYSLETLQSIVASGDHIITWEKGYQRDGWNEKVKPEAFIMRIPRNSSKDLQTYYCFYQVREWEKDQRFRKIIVRITNPSGNTIEVSILSSNSGIHDSDVISYMLRRWLQENDFRYLIKHYGIDQIDSYKSNDYKELEEKEKAHDYLIESRAFRMLLKKKQKLRGQYKKTLENREKKLATFDRRRKKKYDERMEKEKNTFLEIMRNSENGANDKKEQEKKLRKHHQACKKTAEIREKDKLKKEELRNSLDTEIAELRNGIVQIEAEINNTVREESRLMAVIEEKYRRLDTTSKAVLDMLRIMARNSFYALLDDFRPLYDNLRDDHVILRSLVEAPGKIQAVNGVLRVEIMPAGDFPKATIEKISFFLTVTENKINQHFQGKAMPVVISMSSGKNGNSTCARL